MLKLSDLVKELSLDNGISAVNVRNFLNSLSELIIRELKTGEKITIPGIGIFATGNVAARQGRNPQTGESISIAAYTKVKFKPLKSLKDSLK